MPAMLEDPTSAPIPQTQQLPTFSPKHIILKDGITKATIIPFTSLSQAPSSLVTYLCAQLALEIEQGDTYPMMDPMPLSSFGPYWFQNFATVMLLGDISSVEEVKSMENADWEKICPGSFYVKPNYPGRSNHVCNGGFLVTTARRNTGVGKALGQAYLEWAPKLGYTYSVFNLVYETNFASCRIWDSLGFERIGRVKKCGRLRSFPERKIDAIVYGYDFEEPKEPST